MWIHIVWIEITSEFSNKWEQDSRIFFFCKYSSHLFSLTDIFLFFLIFSASYKVLFRCDCNRLRKWSVSVSQLHKAGNIYWWNEISQNLVTKSKRERECTYFRINFFHVISTLNSYSRIYICPVHWSRIIWLP